MVSRLGEFKRGHGGSIPRTPEGLPYIGPPVPPPPPEPQEQPMSVGELRHKNESTFFPKGRFTADISDRVVAQHAPGSDRISFFDKDTKQLIVHARKIGPDITNNKQLLKTAMDFYTSAGTSPMVGDHFKDYR